MINTLYQKKTNEFIEKKAVLKIQAIVEGKGTRTAGTLKLNLSQYFETPLIHKEFPLANCPDKKAVICISINAQAIGEVRDDIDGMSDISGGTGISMGSDLGPLLIADQDLTGFEEEGHAPKIIPNMKAKTLSGRPPLAKMPESLGAINPAKISEAMKNASIRYEESKSPAQLQEAKAQMSLLEKDNQRLKSEKEELKVELGVHIENAKKERERLIEHIKEIDGNLQQTSAEDEALREKLQKRDEQLKKLKSTKESLLKDLQQAEKMSYESSADKERLRNEVAKLKQELQQSNDKNTNLQQTLKEHERQNANLEEAYDKLEGKNETLKKTIEQLRNDLIESQSGLSSRGNQEERDMSEFKKRSEILSNL